MAAVRPLASVEPVARHMAPSYLRHVFAQGLSEMYSREVPQYTKLQKLVRRVSDASRPESRIADPLVPRHGAIRLASLSDFRDTARVLGVMGMRPVGYYDLSPAGLPIHATAFRPLSPDDLAVSPMRLFVSVLRPEVHQSPVIAALLAERRPLFSQRILSLVQRAEEEGGLSEPEGLELVDAARAALVWDGQIGIAKEAFDALRAEKASSLLVDILAFRNPHINHLTPATEDIDAVQEGMPSAGLAPKERVEGPPRRKCPLLLRQTSFLAVEEKISFRDGESTSHGTHTARFGEVEQRGAALTRKGRHRYDEIIRTATEMGLLKSRKSEEEYRRLFNDAFPDDWQALKNQKLVWANYSLTEEGKRYAAGGNIVAGMTLGQALWDGLVSWQPIQYEDFLPFSAAGIFQSNLGNEGTAGGKGDARAPENSVDAKELMRRALPGGGMLDEMEVYARQQFQSLRACCKALCISL